MNEFLKAKTAGLPRWAWAVMLTGAVGLGLYLRSKSTRSEIEEVDGERLETLGSNEGAPGLAAAGLVSTPIAGITPVEAPYIPEGFIDMFASLTDLAKELGSTISNINQTNKENPGPGQSPTGGGPPERPVDHFPPSPAPPSTPQQPAAPSCPAGTVNHIRDLRAERDRLQNEIDQLQNQITNLTNLLQSHPNAKLRPQWEAERNQARGAIDFKRNRVNQINGQIEDARKKPGCANV